MSGFSYNLSKIKAFLFNIDGVLSASVISIDRDGFPLRQINTKDITAIQKAIQESFSVGIISESSNANNYTSVLDIDSKSVYLDVKDKVAIVEEFIENEQIAIENVLYVGSDLSDLDVFQMSCLRVAARDACIEILQRANYISPYRGGYGVVRDVIEQVLKAQLKWNG